MPKNSRSDFREDLLSIMDQKDHWGWKNIVEGKLTKAQLLVHFQQEYATYVRDFPAMLARVLGRMPAEASRLRREFAENIYEEQTGGLSAEISKNKSHPELFLKMMKALGYREVDFLEIRLLPTSLGYRSYLDLITLTSDWRVGAALLGLFVEGSIEDRQRLQQDYKPTKSLNEKLKEHSLHKFYGLKISDMDLVRVHHTVEGGHRKSAWETLVDSIPDALEAEVRLAMQRALELWQLYRDGICVEMGLEYPSQVG